MQETTSTFRGSPSRWPMHRSTRAIKVLLDPDVPSSRGPMHEGGAFFALGLLYTFLFLSFSLSQPPLPPFESAPEQFEPRPRSKQVSPRSFHLASGIRSVSVSSITGYWQVSWTRLLYNSLQGANLELVSPAHYLVDKLIRVKWFEGRG